MRQYSYEDYLREAMRLQSLLDEDPRLAVDEARAMPMAEFPNGLTTDFLKGSIFVDAGDVLDDKELLREGRSIFEDFQSRRPDDPEVVYRLANALSSEVRQTPYKDPSWYLSTAADRLRARRFFRVTSLSDVDSNTRASATTNLGNELWRGHRWVEAYDSYLAALQIDPTNAIARTGAAKVLIGLLQRGIGDSNILRAVLAKHLKRAAVDKHRLAQLAGPKAARSLEPLLDMTVEGGELPPLDDASDYARFVAEHSLALTPTIEGLDPQIERWDTLTMPGIIESLASGDGVPPVFAIFNVAKADFLTARWLCFKGLRREIPETGNFGDTLDYARYGSSVSALTLAQRAALDVLDRIAVFVTDYLGLDEPPRSINFRSRWHKNPKKITELEWHPSIEAEVMAPNRGFIALSDVSIDLGDDGFLSPKIQARHTGTHRVPVLHDLGETPSRPSKYVTHFAEEHFVQELIETLRLARASLLYLVDSVVDREDRIKRDLDGPIGTLFVPDHDWIRGGD